VTTLAVIAAAAAQHRLSVFGAFHADEDDGLPPGTGTLVMLGPDEPGFWLHLTSQPEWRDGRADPVDRWSSRVIGALADRFGATALFPFGGPPYHPFYQWALRTGRQSPCLSCAGQPCRTACPASALTEGGYDLPACHGFLDTADGVDCLSFGCAVRRACPLSRAYGRLPEQSAYHMRLFHR
jgi:hypothetical protein